MMRAFSDHSLLIKINGVYAYFGDIVDITDAWFDVVRVTSSMGRNSPELKGACIMIHRSTLWRAQLES